MAKEVIYLVLPKEVRCVYLESGLLIMNELYRAG